MSADPEKTALYALVLSLQAENERLRKQQSILFWHENDMYCKRDVPTNLFRRMSPAYCVYEARRGPLCNNRIIETYSRDFFLAPTETDLNRRREKPILIQWWICKGSRRQWSLVIGGLEGDGGQTIHASEDEIRSRLQELEEGFRPGVVAYSAHPFLGDCYREYSHLLSAFDNLLYAVRAEIASLPSDYALLAEQVEKEIQARDK